MIISNGDVVVVVAIDQTTFSFVTYAYASLYIFKQKSDKHWDILQHAMAIL